MQPRHACYNHQPLKDTMNVMDGYVDEPVSGIRTFKFRTIPFVNSRDCHIADDPRCGDCRWRPVKEEART